MTRYRAMQPRDPAWYDRQRAHTAELLEILDSPASELELVAARAVLQAVEERMQAELFARGNQ